LVGRPFHGKVTHATSQPLLFYPINQPVSLPVPQQTRPRKRIFKINGVNGVDIKPAVYDTGRWVSIRGWYEKPVVCVSRGYRWLENLGI
jgi:hypothetical protein